MFGISPLFLENLSYKFESLGMCLTLSFFLFLFSLPDNIASVKLILLSFIITLLVLLTYQASIGAFLALLFLTITLELETKPLKEILISACYKSLGFLSAFFLYMLIIAPVIVATDGYQGQVAPRIPFTQEGLLLLIHNFGLFLNLLKTFFFPGLYSPVTCLSIIGLSVLFLYVLLTACHHIKNKDYIKSLITFIAPFAILTSSFFHLCFLKTPVFQPRSMLSFNVFMLLVGIAIIFLTGKHRFAVLIFIPLFLFSFSFISVYSNLLHTQREYEEFIAKSVAYDLNKIKNINNTFIFHIDGRSLPSKELALARKGNIIFHFLIVNIYKEYRWFGAELISHYTNFVLNVKKIRDIDYTKYHTVTENSLYRIMQNQKTIVIDFNHPMKKIKFIK